MCAFIPPNPRGLQQQQYNKTPTKSRVMSTVANDATIAMRTTLVLLAPAGSPGGGEDGDVPPLEGGGEAVVRISSRETASAGTPSAEARAWRVERLDV